MNRYYVEVHLATGADAGWINAAHSPILGMFHDGDYARRWKGAVAVRMVYSDGVMAWNPSDPAQRKRVELVWPPTRWQRRRGNTWQTKVGAAIARMQSRCDERDRQEQAFAMRQEQAVQIVKEYAPNKGESK